jgi:hypothetical protein
VFCHCTDSHGQIAENAIPLSSNHHKSHSRDTWDRATRGNEKGMRSFDRMPCVGCSDAGARVASAAFLLALLLGHGGRPGWV